MGFCKNKILEDYSSNNYNNNYKKQMLAKCPDLWV